jgi:hypothetical protein
MAVVVRMRLVMPGRARTVNLTPPAGPWTPGDSVCGGHGARAARRMTTPPALTEPTTQAGGPCAARLDGSLLVDKDLFTAWCGLLADPPRQCGARWCTPRCRR